MEILFTFLVAAGLSFFGSVFLGLVNVAVIQAAITRSEKSALWLAFGGVLPEIPYSLIAIIGTSYVDLLSAYEKHIAVTISFVFILIGISYLFKKNIEIGSTKSEEVGALAHFTKGLLLAIANPQLIFFWSGYLLLFQTGTFSDGPFFDFSQGIWGIVSWMFALGAAAGAFLILFIYTKLSSIYKEQLVKLIGDKMGKVIGFLFIGLGIISLVSNAL